MAWEAKSLRDACLVFEDMLEPWMFPVDAAHPCAIDASSSTTSDALDPVGTRRQWDSFLLYLFSSDIDLSDTPSVFKYMMPVDFFQNFTIRLI